MLDATLRVDDDGRSDHPDDGLAVQRFSPTRRTYSLNHHVVGVGENGKVQPLGLEELARLHGGRGDAEQVLSPAWPRTERLSRWKVAGCFGGPAVSSAGRIDEWRLPANVRAEVRPSAVVVDESNAGDGSPGERPECLDGASRGSRRAVRDSVDRRRTRRRRGDDDRSLPGP